MTTDDESDHDEMDPILDDDDESEEDEEYEISSEKDESIWDDVKSAWKQHIMAVLVAVVAAVYVHFSSSPTATTSTLSTYFQGLMTGIPHQHLHEYKRTANITFCPSAVDDEQRHHHPSSSLKRFHFLVPKELVYVMEAHFQADELEDDMYEHVWTSSQQVVNHDEYTCLETAIAAATSSSSNIRGYAWGYQVASLKRMFPEAPAGARPASLSFTGFAAKFVNLSSKPVLLHWDGRDSSQARLVGELKPFQALGTATTPGQSFYVSPVFDGTHALQRWTVTVDTALVVYRPDDEREELNPEQVFKRDMQLLNLEFARDYKVATKRTWLAHFPRPHPSHYMRPANFVGQVHTVTTEREDKLLEVKVVSVAPQVFTIDNFLSLRECDYLMEQGQTVGLEASTVVSGSNGGATHTLRHATTRSSFNAWISREHSNATDAIYRRAASILGMDESLFRHRSNEHDEIATHNSLAESLQIVRYQREEEYSAHHDFVHPYAHNRFQPTRFATLLIYLQAPLEGGETIFPRAVTPTNHDGLAIQPKKGMAVLFYNLLPDGNMDDLSQHASKPVLKGEKWLASLWAWDPIID